MSTTLMNSNTASNLHSPIPLKAYNIKIGMETLQQMDEQADKAISNWSFGALAANLLPPPFDMLAVGTVFAEMGVRLARLPQLDLNFAQFTAFSARKCLIGHSSEA